MNESAAYDPDELKKNEQGQLEKSARPENEQTPASEPGSGQQELISIIGHADDASSNEGPTMRVATRCGLGAVRERNDDSCLVFSSEAGGHFPMLPFGLYVVADGMGGHANGHIASKVASRVAARHILNKIYMPLLQGESAPTHPIQEVIVDAVQAANVAVYQQDPDSDSGTTLTVALVLGRRLHIAHVGDTRLYLMGDGEFKPITTDHSLVQRLQDVGQLTAEQATIYGYRHVLLRAIGQEEEVEIDTFMRLLPKKGKLLLCTDGLCGLVSDKEMQAILEQDISLKQMVDKLYDAAMSAGGYDNITAVLVDFTQ